MKNVSTPTKKHGADACMHHRNPAPGPRRSTIILLRQFARAYTCTARLPESLGSFVAN